MHASVLNFFQITMSKKEGAKTVVIGGKKDIRQQYCGIVGGQSSDFSTMDTEVKVRLGRESQACFLGTDFRSL